MIESTESLLPRGENGKLKALCIGIGAYRESDRESDQGLSPDASINELYRLLDTCDVEPIDRIMVALRKISPATFVGAGKVDEIKAQAEKIGAEAIVFDVELSPNQMRNVEKLVGKPVMDRPGVIIEIFSRHARTKESKTQVELARLQYLYPRLAHFWTHFERQRGGIGNKGMGEKQIEVDRRLVKDRISILRKRLKEIEQERKVQRAGRKDVLKVAIVGYTNAGKSTLINALTHSKVLAEDKLFATLDSSVRTLDPHSHPPVVAIDTVGFISNLPTNLIASFRSTLEELHHADLLLHVVDASSREAQEQIRVTEEVLNDLRVGEKPRITVLNKCDQLTTAAARNSAKMLARGATLVSALVQADVDRLRDQILEHFRGTLEVWEVVIPYSESRLESQLHAHGSIDRTKHLEKGTFYKLRIAAGWAKKLDLARFRT